ncbi:hypothetical protein ACU4GD_34425 [Cupriavidus basilensis]
MQRHAPGRTIQRENKRQELGGRLVRPNPIRMPDHFRIAQLIGLPGAAALWDKGFEQLQPLALLPYATTRARPRLRWRPEELMAVPMLRTVFEATFSARLRHTHDEALFVALAAYGVGRAGPCGRSRPAAAVAVAGHDARARSPRGQHGEVFCGRSPPANFAARSRAPPHRLARRRACRTDGCSAQARPARTRSRACRALRTPAWCTMPRCRSSPTAG